MSTDTKSCFPMLEELGAKFGRVVLSLNMIDDIMNYAKGSEVPRRQSVDTGTGWKIFR